MAFPTTEAAIATLEEGHGALQSLLARIADEDMIRPSTIGGGDWSAKDLLGHIAFWKELALAFVADWRAGRLPSITSIFAEGQAGIDATNARNQAITREQSLADVRQRANETHLNVIEMIHGLTADEWIALPFYPTPVANRPLGQLLGGILGGPDRLFAYVDAHLADLRAYVESLNSK